jgi:hypothetical protein
MKTELTFVTPDEMCDYVDKKLNWAIGTIIQAAMSGSITAPTVSAMLPEAKPETLVKDLQTLPAIFRNRVENSFPTLTVGELVIMHRRDLKRWRHVGDKTITDTKTALLQYGVVTTW